MTGHSAGTAPELAQAVTHESEPGVSLPGTFLSFISANYLRCWCSGEAGALLPVPSRRFLSRSPHNTMLSPGSTVCHPGVAMLLQGGKEGREKRSCCNTSWQHWQVPDEHVYEPFLILLWWERYRLKGFAGLRCSLRGILMWWG